MFTNATYINCIFSVNSVLHTYCTLNRIIGFCLIIFYLYLLPFWFRKTEITFVLAHSSHSWYQKYIKINLYAIKVRRQNYYFGFLVYSCRIKCICTKKLTKNRKFLFFLFSESIFLVFHSASKDIIYPSNQALQLVCACGL